MDKPQSSDIIFYSSPQGNVRIEVLYAGETFWLSQKRMAELFGVEVPAVSKHLKNIFDRQRNSVSGLLKFCGSLSSKGLSWMMSG